jgi:hypothetical protein
VVVVKDEEEAFPLLARYEGIIEQVGSEAPFSSSSKSIFILNERTHSTSHIQASSHPFLMKGRESRN